MAKESLNYQNGGDINPRVHNIDHKSSANGETIIGDKVESSFSPSTFNSNQVLDHISSNTGKHNTQMWLAKEFQLDFDFSFHRTEIEFIYILLIQLLSNSPYSPQPLKIGSTTYPLEKARGILIVMEKKGLVTSPKKSTYILSHKIKEKLQMIMNDVASLQLTGTAP